MTQVVSNAAVARSMGDILVELGGISIDRICRLPAPGTATLDDARSRIEKGDLFELVDPRERSVAVFTSITDYVVLDDTQTLTGGDVLSGLEVDLAKLFAELDRRPNP